MPEPRVALLNPPGNQIYLRDYYCSKTSQADYLNAPIDLLFASGTLRDAARLELVDAIADGQGVEACLRQLESFAPDLVFGLIGSASYSEDLEFYSRLDRRIVAPIVLSGDILQEDPVPRLEALTFADAFLHDFTAPALLRYLQGERRPNHLAGMTYRQGREIVCGSSSRSIGTRFDINPPLHELFLSHRYRYPFVRQARFATVLTDFGCPYRCSFCVMPGLGWKVRSHDSVSQELEDLARLGVRELFFLDQTFGLRPARARRLMQALRRGGFGWVCFNRPDLVDRERAMEMAACGCHTMILGLESGSETILRAARKEYSRGQVLEGFAHCRATGIRTVATVIVGLPEETEATFRETLDFLEQVDPDFASFNVAVPRMSTPLRRRAARLGLIDAGLDQMDQSGRPPAMPTLALSREEIQGLRRKAVRRFYLRPGYLAKQMGAMLGSGRQAEWASHFRQALTLFRNAFS